MISEHDDANIANSEIQLPARRRQRAIRDWRRRPAPSQTPAPPPPSISQLMDACSWANQIAIADPTRRNRHAALYAREALGEARERAATEFGRVRNWKLAQRGFMLQDLIAGRNGWRTRPDHAFVDHGSSYRCGARPAAFVAQPYRPAFKLDRAQAFADEHGLAVSVAEGVESWWNPGKCLVVIWERGSPPPQTPSQVRRRLWGAR